MATALREHVRGHHPRLRPARSNNDLARQHAREHYHYRCDHTHGPAAAETNAGPLIGPGSKDRRPAGWYTGEDAEMRPGQPTPP